MKREFSPVNRIPAYCTFNYVFTYFYVLTNLLNFRVASVSKEISLNSGLLKLVVVTRYFTFHPGIIC